MRRVFVSGCFDVLHPGHLEFLSFARSLGDHLTVSLGSDDTIKDLKGHLPFVREHDRYRMLLALECVDCVVVARGNGRQFDFEPYLKDWATAHAGSDLIWVLGSDDAFLDMKTRMAKTLDIRVAVSHRPLMSWKTSRILDKLYPERNEDLLCRPEPRTPPDVTCTSF